MPKMVKTMVFIKQIKLIPELLISVFSVFLFLTSISHAWDLGVAGSYHFEKVNNNVYVMHGPLAEPNVDNFGFMNNPGVIIAENGLIVVDPGSTYFVGQQVLKEIEKISNKPILAVFNTHIHGDHWLANQAIKEKYPKVKLFGHPNMIQQANAEQGLIWIDLMSRLTEGKSNGTQVVAPDIAVDHKQSIEVDGQHFRIHAFIPAHTNTDIMIEHIESKTLFLGDNSFYKRMGRFDGSASMLGNIKALFYAEDLKMHLYIPGHGQSGKSDTAVKAFRDYLIKVRDVVKDGFEDELQDFEIKAKVIAQFENYQSWEGFDTNFGKHINSMYLEIEKQAW
jgi:glyoxylase-like metal-dependent hydrolase (beta-lactamase superfamily II)